MTSKDYILIAKAISQTNNATTRTYEELSMSFDVATALATFLESDNPRFDRQRFLSACLGINQEVK